MRRTALRVKSPFPSLRRLPAPLGIDGLPMPLRIEDFSRLKRQLPAPPISADALQRRLASHPGLADGLVQQVELVVANRAELALHGVGDRDLLADRLAVARRSQSLQSVYREAVVAFAGGARDIGRRCYAIASGGTEVVAECRLTLHRGDDWSRVIWCEWDVSERDRRAGRLRLEVERLKVVVTHAPLAIFLTDIDGRLLLANDRAGALCGTAPDRLVDRSAYALFGAGDARMLERLDRRVLETRAQVQEEVQMPGAERQRHLVFTKFPILDSFGLPIAIGTIATDVTAQRQVEEQAQRLIDELAHAERRATAGELSAMVSHELNQPLAAILNFARSGNRLLQAGRLAPAETGDILGKIAAEAQRAADILQSLRRLVRKRGGTLCEVDLNAVVASVMRLITPSLKLEKVRLDLHLTEALPKVLADPIGVEQVILNLVTNAVEAMRAAPLDRRVLTIATTPRAGEVAEITVGDTGPPIPEELASRIFDPFTTSKEDGTGLGLSISHTLVERYGGVISFSPLAEAGKTFRVALPVSRSQTGGARS